MATKIFVNLAVKDLDKSMRFFEQLRFSFNPQFTDKTAACMVISDDIYAMLLTHPKIKQFTKKRIADAHETTEVLTALSVESKEKVHEMADAAIGPVGRRYASRKITASCLPVASRTPTGIFGKRSGWILPTLKRDNAVERTCAVCLSEWSGANKGESHLRGHEMKPRIQVVTLAVSDLDTSLAFYHDGLDLPTQGITGQNLRMARSSSFT
jgi:uncharacterized protein